MRCARMEESSPKNDGGTVTVSCLDHIGRRLGQAGPLPARTVPHCTVWLLSVEGSAVRHRDSGAGMSGRFVVAIIKHLGSRTDLAWHGYAMVERTKPAGTVLNPSLCFPVSPSKRGRTGSPRHAGPKERTCGGRLGG
jgi:hypothetical protein